MCGRFAQYRPASAYAAAIGWPDDGPGIVDDLFEPSWNIPPGSSPLLMHRFDVGKERIERIHWGYRPSWAAEKKIPVAINARIEKAASGAYFRGLWKSGRAIVPADGWYEWSGEAGHKQPWYIRLKNNEPMFFAAITDCRPGKQLRGDSGFVIVTAAADGGLVDVHDRRPVVFSAKDAELWMDLTLPAEQAEHLARSLALGPDSFDWYRVSTEVNRAGHNGAHLIEPIQV